MSIGITPENAHREMRKIAEKRDEPRRYHRAIELIAKIAVWSGYCDTVDVFREILEDEGRLVG